MVSGQGLIQLVHVSPHYVIISPLLTDYKYDIVKILLVFLITTNHSISITQWQKGLFGWWEVILHWKVVLRSFTLASGALCVMNTGTWMMLWLCAVNWATYKQLKLPGRLSLELEVVLPGITDCIVQGQSAT